MTDLRTAAQQALEALELGYDSAKAEADQYHAAMAGYRPQRHAQMDADVQQIASAMTALKAALAEPVQEPVAWVLALPDGRLDRLSVVAYDDEAEEMLQRSIAGCTLVPLYAAPPQRKPLTEEEIDELSRTMVKGDMSVNWLCRTIERAHGIV